MRFWVEVKSVTFENEEAFEKTSLANVKYEIDFHGKYAIYAEFGTPPLKLRDDIVVQLTQAYESESVPNALEEATKLANELMLKGKKPQPFLRPALAVYAYSLGKQDITDIVQLEQMIKSIAGKSKEIYEHNERRSEFVKVPLKYTIYAIRGNNAQNKEEIEKV